RLRRIRSDSLSRTVPGQQAPFRARSQMVETLQRDELAVRPPEVGQDRHQGHQPLRRRGAEGVGLAETDIRDPPPRAVNFTDIRARRFLLAPVAFGDPPRYPLAWQLS